MTDFASFGNPARFEIALRWTGDSEPRARRPAAHGWSMGDLRITIGGAVVTKSRRGAVVQGHVGWYLAPFIEWLVDHWIALLHEEGFAWTERGAAPAAVACYRALESSIGLRDEPGKAQYRAIQAWYRRHSVRAAAAGGLFPDLFIRRFLDEIELSWSNQPPLFAPEDLVFAVEPGLARMAVADVAAPLWALLNWVAAEPPADLDRADRERHAELVRRIDALRQLAPSDFERAFVSPQLLDQIRAAFIDEGRSDLMDEHIRDGRPFVEVFSPAVAMFGGVSPQLGRQDIATLRAVLTDHAGGGDSVTLARLLRTQTGHALGTWPHKDGYAMAEECLDELGVLGRHDPVDVMGICGMLGIEIIERALATDTIRGVALAGEGFGPTILVNLTSIFNANAAGRRFSIAHELCHVIHDRSRARRIAHVSGPWALPAIEKRANAFAAWFLMPRPLLLRQLAGTPEITNERITEISTLLQVNETALIEHLYNIDLISEGDRERLRGAFRRH